MNKGEIGSFDLLSGADDMRALMRAHDWTGSPLGHPHTWPQALRTVVSLMLDSKFPMFVAWGAELGFLYNDSYAEILGAKHPAALGSRFQDIWSEIWPVISPIIDRALDGEASFHENLPLAIVRKGHQEQTWFTFSYSPVRDESGAVIGMYCACTETTSQVLAERRQAFQLEMSDRLRGLAEPNEITSIAAESLGRHLGVARVGYGEIDRSEKIVSVAQDWTSGLLPSLAGEARPLASFGPAIIDELRGGRALRLDDIAADPRSAPYAAGYAGIGTRSLLVVPLLREGRFSAILYLHEPMPRCWTDEDAVLAHDVAERTWATVERARAEENRRRAEQALSRQLAAEGDRLRALFEQAPGFMAVMRGADHVFELVNAAYMRLVGDRNILGKPVREALPDVEGQGFFELLDRVFASGEPFFAREAPLLVQLAPGAAPTQRFVDFIFQPVTEADGSVSGIFVEGYDVTERRHATEALRGSEARYRTLIENISLIVWHTNVEGAFVAENASWEAFTGQSQAEYLGRGWLDAVHPDDRAQTAASWRQALSALAPYEAACRLRRRDGQYRDVLVRGAPVWTGDGHLAEWVGNCTDVTEAKRADEALRAADRRKDEFLAMLAHELRNPLAPINTAAQLLKLARLDEQRVQQTSEIISRQVDHMTNLVDDLLDVSRVTRGLVVLAREPLDLADVISDAVEQVRSLIEARRHRLTVQMPAQPARVQGDRTRLVQVIANLLNNAAKYTPEGGGIVLRTQAGRNEVELSVRDNGIGIPSELLSHVFDLFSQGARSPDRSQGGLGLGLTLVKSLVQLHEGSVAAFSAGPGKGSEFTLRLPRLAEAAAQPQRSQRATALASASKALRLMIVDDNVDAARSLAMLIEAEGHSVRMHHDARSALGTARAEAPCVFLLDIGLPDMDGYELARRLRSFPETSQAVLIALTGYGQAQDRERSKAAGFDYHLVKPADMKQLAALLVKIGSMSAAPEPPDGPERD